MNDENILKEFGQDAQLREERIPMKATSTEAQRVATKLKEFMELRKLKQVDVARMLGVGITKFNLFLRGKYKAKKGVEELVNKGLQLIESFGRKDKRIKSKPYVETTVAKQIAALILKTESFSDIEGKIGLLIGDGGHGKSICLQQYAKANRNTVYVELDDAMTPTAMFAAIAEKLNIDSSGSLTSITRRLIDSLFYRHIIIMLDEAAGLNVQKLNQLRQIIVVKARCPLILAGNSDLLKTVMQPKTRRGCESLDQFTSRLSYILNLDEMATRKDGGIYTVEDIRKLYEHGGIRLTGDAVNTLQKICKASRTGRLRTCSHIIAALHTSRKVLQSGIIDAITIVSVIEQLGLPVKVWLPLAVKDSEEQKGKPAVAKAAG